MEDVQSDLAILDGQNLEIPADSKCLISHVVLWIT